MYQIIEDNIQSGAFKHRIGMKISLTEPPPVPVNVDWNKRTITLVTAYKPVLDRILNLEIRSDDVWIVTIAKSGTTWMQEMSWLLLNDFNYEQAKSTDLTERSPFLEFACMQQNSPVNTIDEIENLPSPRLIKTHLPLPLLPRQLWTKKPKIIYVVRDPKDIAVSSFHHLRGLGELEKDDQLNWFRHFTSDPLSYATLWDHVLDFWYLRNENNVLFTSYERMKTELRSVVMDVCDLLQKPPIDEDQMLRLMDHLSFNKMKENASCNHEKETEEIRKINKKDSVPFQFIRKGIVGGYKDEMPDEAIQQFNEWIQKNLGKHNLTLDDLLYFKANKK